MLHKYRIQKTFNTTDGAQVIDFTEAVYREIAQQGLDAVVAKWHQLTIESTASAGTFEVSLLFDGKTGYVSAYPVTGIACTGAMAYMPLMLEGVFNKLKITPTGTGSGISYTATLNGYVQ